MRYTFNANKRDAVRKARSTRAIGLARGSISGLMPFRGGEAVGFESTLERDFLIRLETDRKVARVTSQPVTIEYQGADERLLRYTPDYLVEYDPKPVWAPFIHPILVEVKPRLKLAKHLAEWRPRFRAAMRYCRA
ncbi:MAG: Tn7 transposase TnsA N-terminal domain-containing protein, partial [Gammaproteobacteria bacterium]